MEQMFQLKTWRCGLAGLATRLVGSYEFWWIGVEPSEQHFVVGQTTDHGIPMTRHRSLGQL